MKFNPTQIFQLVPALLLGCAMAAHSASFDCQRAKSVNEHLICDDAELSQLDDELAQKYKDAQRKSATPKDLISNQREAWRRREKECTSKLCLVDWFAQRMSYLSASQQNQPAVSRNYPPSFNNKTLPHPEDIVESRENNTTEIFPANVKKSWTYKPFSITSTQHRKQMNDAHIANTFMCKPPMATLQATMDLFQNYDFTDSSKTDGTLTVTSFRGMQEGKKVTVSLAVDEQSTPRLVRYILVDGMPALSCN